MSSINIRLAKPDDLKQVQELNHQLFLSDSRHFKDLNTNWPYEEGEEYFLKRIAGKEGVCFVAEQDETLIGYVIGGWSHLNFSAYKGRRAELENICVDENSRGQGIGSMLVKELYQWCKQNNATYVMVDVFSPNIQAYKFYEKQGFTPYSSVLWHKC